MAIFFWGRLHAQSEIQKFVQDSTVSITTINPDSVDYANLSPIANAIGNSRVVMLGEQDHGDAPAFIAKTMLIKYLHEKLGFNVLAFESDFFGLNKGWDNLAKDTASVKRFTYQNIFPIWTGCDACQELFSHYIPGSFLTVTPLTVTGFDDQLMLNYSQGRFIIAFDSVLTTLKLPITVTPGYKTLVLPLIDSLNKVYWYKKPSQAIFDSLNTYLTLIKTQASTKLPADDFWMNIINNLQQESTEYNLLKTKLYRDGENARDKQMAFNLAWLCNNKYAGEKIIVWAANAHVAKYADTVKSNPAQHMEAMGYYFTHLAAPQVPTYVIGFSSYGGVGGRLGFKDYTIPQPKNNSFENWVNSSYNYAFTNLKNFNALYPGYGQTWFMQGLGHVNMQFKWQNLYDGVFFIRNIYTCKKQ